ncbi:xanthine dehydrogenase small subunit [Thermosporothrix hazakensis]|jgi:CO/xanthine dehydrogenase FAD-binding subunit|uniref:Xanthine dehydrogenase small subunit n=2 Tax=Thermosporothrix TaxID=768650 RepID=A0A326UC58_THEHA|nr:FAD binding domain-containing protein [Thermosporothrix hazakensis]PZW32955.1 xanthine dehydrogenase small subunit [Thermosporothrix hazakensis]BBH90937.1 hypothetical protein KTC_56880 [Thermosporothrix sp. COM3]GCE48987.1 hypothetical protein KTH_38560 [Thermosporothrix hazakensis]
MLLRLVEYHWAEHLDDALLLLGRLDVKTVPLAGGTYLLNQDDDSIQAVVDLRDLGLSYIQEKERTVHLGAMTTLQALLESPVMKQRGMEVLAAAAQASAPSHLIRNSATVGGTLGAGLAAQADLLPVLVAFDAEAVVRSGSKTELNLTGGSFQRSGLPLSGVVFKGKQERRLAAATFELERRPNELIIEVVMPRPVIGCGTSFQRISSTPTDVALLNASALVEIEEGRYKRVRLVFGGVNMEPVRIRALEQMFEGQVAAQPPDSERIQAVVRHCLSFFRPPSDFRASNGYRRVVAMSLGQRALEEAFNVAHWRSIVASGTDK